jgi:streptogramin lyase
VRAALLLVLIVVLATTADAKLPPRPTETAIVSTGRAPCGLAVDGGRLLVGVYETGRLLRIDRSGRVVGRTRVGRFACRIAVGGGATWVTRDNANEIVRVDGRGRLRRIAVPSPLDVTVAAGSVWMTSFETGTVTRLDLAGRRRAVLNVGANPTGVAACGGLLWVGHGRDATWLTAIDPRTGRTSRVDVVVRTPRWPRCVRGELWVTTEDSALRLAPRTGALRGHFRLGPTLAEAGAARSEPGTWAVWVTDKERSLVHRIDPLSGQVVDSFPAGPGALALARFAGSVWVTSFAGSDVRRFDP